MSRKVKVWSEDGKSIVDTVDTEPFLDKTLMISDKNVFDFFMKVIHRDTLIASNPDAWRNHPLTRLIIKGALNNYGDKSFHPVPKETLIKWAFEHLDEDSWRTMSLLREIAGGPEVPQEHLGRNKLLIQDFKKWGKEKGYIK